MHVTLDGKTRSRWIMARAGEETYVGSDAWNDLATTPDPTSPTGLRPNLPLTAHIELEQETRREALRSAVRLASDERPLSLALLDLDHFKRINDVHGHAVGDEVLVTAVERLAGATAGLGTFARVGGEEFALLMPDTDVVAGRRIVRRAIEALRATGLPIVGHITASAGVAQLQGDMTDDELYRLADGLLYEAKDQGRDQVR